MRSVSFTAPTAGFRDGRSTCRLEVLSEGRAAQPLRLLLQLGICLAISEHTPSDLDGDLPEYRPCRG